jgi:hypothetical protein
MQQRMLQGLVTVVTQAGLAKAAGEQQGACKLWARELEAAAKKMNPISNNQGGKPSNEAAWL